MKFPHHLIVLLLVFIPQFGSAQLCAASFNGIFVDTCHLNQAALSIKDSEKDVDDIAEFIKTNAASEQDKVYLIYTWIAGQFKYDLSRMEQIFKGKIKREMYTTELLTKRKGVCGDFANLFKELCDSVGVPCFRVSGYTKTFRPFHPIRKKHYDHAWNVVRVAGIWYPIDVTWGIRQYTKKEYNSEKINYDFLFANEDEFNIRHLAGDPTFQLTKEQITYKTFRWKKSRQTDIPYNTVDPDTLMNRLYAMNEKDQVFAILDHQVTYLHRAQKVAVSRLRDKIEPFVDKKNPANKKLTRENYETAIEWYTDLGNFAGNKLEGRFGRRMVKYCNYRISELRKAQEKLKK